MSGMVEAEDILLFSYAIASADMRYIEVNEEEIFLRYDPGNGPVVRGEIPGCGDGCHANLSQIFLEYALTCEGCNEQIVASESMTRFGVRLGKLLAANLCRLGDGLSTIDQLAAVFECILNSMNAPFEVDYTPDKIHYQLAYSPIDKAADDAGFSRVLPLARKSFLALCESILRTLRRIGLCYGHQLMAWIIRFMRW